MPFMYSSLMSREHATALRFEDASLHASAAYRYHGDDLARILMRYFTHPIPMRDVYDEVGMAPSEPLPRMLIRPVDCEKVWKDSSGIFDIIRKSGGGSFVSEHVKAIIESLEPGVHEFTPIEVHLDQEDGSTGPRVDRDFFAFRVLRQIDCIILEKTNVHNDKSLPGEYYPGFPETYTLDAKSIEGLQIWRGSGGFYMWHFISDELKELLDKNELLGWQYEQCIVENMTVGIS